MEPVALPTAFLEVTMAERIISADSHVDISRDRVLANLPSQYHEAYKETGMPVYAPRARAWTGARPASEGQGGVAACSTA